MGCFRWIATAINCIHKTAFYVYESITMAQCKMDGEEIPRKSTLDPDLHTKICICSTLQQRMSQQYATTVHALIPIHAANTSPFSSDLLEILNVSFHASDEQLRDMGEALCIKHP